MSVSVGAKRPHDNAGVKPWLRRVKTGGDLKETYCDALCVWQDAPFEGPDSLRLLQNAYNIRTLLVETVRTIATDGCAGGRRDVFFRVHEEDACSLAARRFAMFSDECGTSFLYFNLNGSVDGWLLERMAREELNEVCCVLRTPQSLVLSFQLFDLDAYVTHKDVDRKYDETDAAIDGVMRLEERASERWSEFEQIFCLKNGCMRWWQDIVDNDQTHVYSKAVQAKYCSAMPQEKDVSTL